MSHFANCSEFNDSQLFILTALRGGTSAAACVATLILLIVICACQSKLKLGRRKTCLKMYLFGLFGVSISYLTVLSLAVVYHLLPASSARAWCAVFGFLNQVLSVIQITLLFINTNPIVLFLWSEIIRGREQRVCCKKNWIRWGSVGTAIVLATMIVISSFIPFKTGTYGEIGCWCWILSIDENCEVLVVGLLEQIFLWFVYKTLITLICFVMILTAVVLFLRACAHRFRVYHNLDDRYDYKYLFYKYFFQLIILVPVAFNFASITLTDHIHHYSFSLWVFFALVPPVNGFLIPLSFLIFIKFGNVGTRDTLPPVPDQLPVREYNRHSMHSTPDLIAKAQGEQYSFGVTARGDITSKFTASSSQMLFLSAEEDPSWIHKYGATQLEGHAQLYV